MRVRQWLVMYVYAMSDDVKAEVAHSDVPE